MAETIIGLDIGGTKTAVVEGSFTGQILSRRQTATDPQAGFRTTFERLCNLVNKALVESTAAGRHPAALSVSIGGPLDITRGIIYGPDLTPIPLLPPAAPVRPMPGVSTIPLVA